MYMLLFLCMWIYLRRNGDRGMRIDQRKKWYQKIKYNKNFKIVSFITIILVCVVGYMMITGKNRVGEETDDNNDGNSVETIVIEAPDDPLGDLKQYVEADTDSTEIAEYDYTIQGAGTVASKKKEDKGSSSSGTDRTSGGSGYGGSSVVISGMENSVRVILTNGGDYYQSYVEFTCSTGFNVTSDGKKKTYKADEFVSLGSDNKASSIIVEPESSDGMITVSSLSKSSGTPRYHGALEITKDSSGYMIINQVDIEQYLYGVVSSEVSSSYSPEALKAMAICARGFTYRKLGSNYRGYNADLDDTTSCQVYNNFPETGNSIDAVQSTSGIVPTYNGEIINAVYFSTSCGTTTTSDQVWGGSMPYTCTRIQNTALDIPYFSDEAAFRDFMDGKTDTDVVERNLLSIGTIGLIKAIDSYRPDKGCKLSGYAAKCIENELLMTLRHEKKKAREVSIYDPIGTDKEGNEIVILDIIGSENVNVLDKMIQDDHLCLLPSCISSLLSSREREIICMRYGLDGQSPLTQKEVARLLGISRSYVSRIEKKALGKLRGCLD